MFANLYCGNHSNAIRLAANWWTSWIFTGHESMCCRILGKKKTLFYILVQVSRVRVRDQRPNTLSESHDRASPMGARLLLAALLYVQPLDQSGGRHEDARQHTLTWRCGIKRGDEVGHIELWLFWSGCPDTIFMSEIGLISTKNKFTNWVGLQHCRQIHYGFCQLLLCLSDATWCFFPNTPH